MIPRAWLIVVLRNWIKNGVFSQYRENRCQSPEKERTASFCGVSGSSFLSRSEDLDQMSIGQARRCDDSLVP
jgi:hypothetical protein